MRTPFRILLVATLSAGTTMVAAEADPVPAASGPAPVPVRSWDAPEVLVEPSAFHGVHGLAIDGKGRLLAGTVLGSETWEIDRATGAAKVFIPAPEGEADDIAVGPKGELAWASYAQGIVRYREQDGAPIREVAKDLVGVSSLAFDQHNGKLYASQIVAADALWELDVTGNTPPRLIKRDLGGFNGFDVGPDGRLYGPLWSKGQVVKVNPRNGDVTLLNNQFKLPAAGSIDKQLNLWVVDSYTGVLSKIALPTARRTDIKRLATSLDDLAIAPDTTIYVSNMADNSVVSVSTQTGEEKTLLRGKLAAPSGIKLDGDTLYVADVFAFRAVDTKTGAVRDVFRANASRIEYPGAVGLGSKLVALTSATNGSVQLLERGALKEVAVVRGFKLPYDAIPLDDGALLVLEAGTGSLVRASGPAYDGRYVVASDLVGPTQMILARDGSAAYVTEAAGRLTKISLPDGAKTVLVEQMRLPEGLTETPWGTLVVAETELHRLLEVDPKTLAIRVVAKDLPIGLPGRPGRAPAYPVTGVAAGADGSLYVTADMNNSLLRLRPKN